jgi:BirA family biotin operon repressor/biotin-[acetyl-CoA-carboxylase] ligase
MQLSDKQQQILALLVDGQFHSGSELAVKLNISRSAVWKHSLGLAALGIAYSAVRGKGYRLDKPLELLDAKQINSALNAQSHTLIERLEIAQHIASTNSYLVDLGEQNQTGIVCFAEQQSAGKGRRGRHWVSPFGSNIYLSILWRYELNGPAALSGLSLAVGVAVIRVLKNMGIDAVGLKWPNDLISQGKKLGGILIEVSGESAGPCTAVVGLGLNVHLPASQAAAQISQAWTDLTQLLGQNTVSRNQLAAALLNELLPVIAHFENTGLSAYLSEWRRYDCLKGQAALLFVGSQTFAGTVLGVDDNGLLLFEKTDGTEQAFASGEVSFSSAT